MLRRVMLAAMVVGLAAGAGVRAQVMITEPVTPLLPEKFGQWVKVAAVPIGVSCSNVANSCQSLEFPVAPGMSLVNADKAALEEDKPQRSAVADYQREGRKIHVEAIEFADRTGAFSAFTLMEKPGMRESKELGSTDAVGDGAVLFTVGSTVVLVNGAGAGDVAGLKPLVAGLPKVFGGKGVAPLLPTLVAGKGLLNGSVKYATGPETYAAQGGVLPAKNLGWEKYGEAVTAQYADKRGKETLTLLLYPTPTLAMQYQKQIEAALPGMGPAFANAKVRRELELVMLAEGSFAPDEAQKMVENIHLNQVANVDRDFQIQPTEHTKVVQTYSLLTNIAVLAGVLMTAAVLLGLFLGGGRALYRVARGKPPGSEAEFLSLKLAPQNKPVEFEGPEGPGTA